MSEEIKKYKFKIDPITQLLVHEESVESECKHCNSPFPNTAQLLRESFRMTKDKMIGDMLRRQEDKGFEEIQNAKYCCSGSQYDAEDAYDEYFPYYGIGEIESLIKNLHECTLYLSQAFRPEDLTAEKCMELDTCDGEIAQYMQDMTYTYKRLTKLCYNVKKALERETDPERRSLLKGRWITEK